MNVLHMQFLDILVKGKQMKEKRCTGSKKKAGSGEEDAVCDSIIHEVQFYVNCQMIS